MRGRRLFDASSIFAAIRSERPELLFGEYTLDLARYELTNAVWKECCLRNLLSPEAAERLLGIIVRAVDRMEALGLKGLEADALRFARDLRLTAYDASYVAASMRHGLVLVTEDERLRRAASAVVESVGLRELIGGQGPRDRHTGT